jgi:hypothetical protein
LIWPFRRRYADLMPAPKRRRWFSLSLRTLLIGMTLISVGFASFLH